MKKIETETIISFNDNEHFAQISTRQKTIKTRMAKIGIKPDYKQGDYECYRLPKIWIKINPPKKMSETQKEAARRNLLKSPISSKRPG